MTGLEIFDYYLDKFDDAGTADGEYAQLLMTIIASIGEDIFKLLEDAHNKGKCLGVDQNLDGDICIDDISIEDIVLV